MKIAFIHPDLGIGGAERLVVDAAVGLQSLGNDITVYTSYCDQTHCFDEVKDGTLKVRVRGDTLVPASILGRFAILCAMLRQLHLAVSFLRDEHYDAVFIDQLSVAIPLLQYFRPDLRILFYCHFPDKLLSQRTGPLKRLYRVPFDFIEGWTTGRADTILVNSRFTAGIFAKAFPRIKRSPKVLYPCVDIHQSFPTDAIRTNGRKVLLSINRFEKKKNVDLAILAYGRLKSHPDFVSTVLVIAGGYDKRVTENVQCHEELVSLCRRKDLSVSTVSAFSLPLVLQADVQVYFLLSIPGSLKASLLATSTLLLYTPENEHFGIVPIEASLAQLPVLAQNNGGPLETILDGETGYLRPADPALWSTVMESVCFQKHDKEMGRRGRQNVLDKFSQESMSRKLMDEFDDIIDKPARGRPHLVRYLITFLVILYFSLRT